MGSDYKPRHESSQELADRKSREFWARLFGLDLHTEGPPLTGKDLAGLFDDQHYTGLDAVEAVRRIRRGLPYITSEDVKPVIVVGREMEISPNRMERNRFYKVEYGGQQYAVRLTEDGTLETYEIKEADKSKK